MIDKKLIEKTLSLWGIKNTKVELIAYRENITFKAQDDFGNKLVLRFHRKNYSHKYEIVSELLWLEALNEKDINVPKPVKSIQNNYIENIEGQLISILSWINGLPLTKINENKDEQINELIFFNLGKEIAKIHKFSDDWIKTDQFRKRKWDIEGLLGENPVWDKFWTNPELTQTQTDQINSMKKQSYFFLKKMIGELDYGLIHADAVRDNVLVQDNYKVNLIDFDDSGFGFRLFDIATTLLHYIKDKNYLIIKKNILKGYLSVRFLDFNFLNIFILIRSFTYVGWNISRINEPNGKKRNKKYIENIFTVSKKLEIKFLSD
jgi:Ser/Thr protein kinase RdoA (MazF antagonist)